MKKKRTLKLSKAERARRRKQARKNFGSTKSRSKVRSKKLILRKIRRRRNPMARRKSKVRRSKPYSLLATTVLPGFAYGAARATVSRWLAPLTAKIPGGRYADNIVMGAVAWLVSKYGRLPLLKKAGRAGLVVESAFLGADVVGARVAAPTAATQSFR